nr:unnamed protein product [Digitaria exilis]
MALNASTSMSWISIRVDAFSPMSPKNPAMKTGDLAASTDLCAGIDSPATTKVMSAPSWLLSSSPNCSCRSEDGALAAMASDGDMAFLGSRTINQSDEEDVE